jgi:AcrR family transcriptional regulator
VSVERTAASNGGPRRRPSRREEILGIAVGLFAARGYHGVSMDDIGSAAGVTGPALYHHFAGKEAMLIAALIPVSEGLREGGRRRVAESVGDRAALEALVDFHVEFALDNPAVISIQLGELDRLPDESRRLIRRLQREYVEEWVAVLTRIRTGLTPDAARVCAHAAFGLMNSTPFIRSPLPRSEMSALLRGMALAALRGDTVT